MTRPPDDFPWDTLARHFAGELDPPADDELRRWIAADPARQELVDELRRLWTETGDLRQSWDAEAALHRIRAAPAGPARVIRLPRFYHQEPASRWRRAGRTALQVAAALALVLGGARIWQETAGRSVAPTPAPALAEVSTPRGQRAVLRLPDGTRVMLAPASVLRYAVAPGSGPRAVHLEGEAYFTVTHDSTRPFAVHTARGVATDLGTRFGVQAYASDSTLVVVVAEGKVALSPRRDTLHRSLAHDRLLLAQGDLGRVARDGRLTATRGVSVDRYLAWTEGRLEFSDTPLGEALIRIGRWHDLEIRLADPALGRRPLTASFNDEPAAEVLRLIAASLDLRVEQRGKLVVIRSR